MSGEALRAKADKKASASGGWSFFGGGGSSKWEEAHDLYAQAGNAFRLEKRWRESGDAYCKAAEMSVKAGELDDAANDYWTASKSYKKATGGSGNETRLAVSALQQTIELYKQKGRLRQAADREKDIAQILAQEGGDVQGALEAYERAGDLYSSEDATATANQCFKEAADLAATLEQYPRAVGHYERVAQASLGNPMTKYGVKEYFLKSGLCWLASGDVVSAKRALENYEAMDATFVGTREQKFLAAIMEAYDAGDPEAYTNEVAEFDRMLKLDNWKTAILLKIKKSIAEEPGLT